MPDNAIPPDRALPDKLKWLMFFRVLFTSLLLGSTIILQIMESPSPLDRPLIVLYAMIAGIFLISFGYAVTIQRFENPLLFAYLQITVDTLFVTLIIFVTGSFSSIFSFLYLVVITYSSLFLYQRGSLLMAGLCTIEYGAMVALEFYEVISPYLIEGVFSASHYPWSHVLYKVMIIMVACFAVAYLSGVLAEQVRKTRIELEAMENHVKRVEKMAYMGQMAANMAHEIKNPLASLAGSIQLLREDLPYNPDHDKLMQIVLRETGRLSDLVSDFLMFAKPTVGKVEAFLLDRAVGEIVELFEKNEKCRERIAVTCELLPDVWVEMDPLHLRQVLWNLLLNAAEAIDGTGAVKVSLEPEKPQEILLSIADNGRGIPDTISQSIFDPFFTTKPKGSGLGLSIVHSILEAYGSRLDITSHTGRGTQVTVKFKRIPQPT